MTKEDKMSQNFSDEVVSLTNAFIELIRTRNPRRHVINHAIHQLQIAVDGSFVGKIDDVSKMKFS